MGKAGEEEWAFSLSLLEVLEEATQEAVWVQGLAGLVEDLAVVEAFQEVGKNV